MVKVFDKRGEISIALCTCEGSLFLNKQLKSLTEQTLQPEELVVCDDSSTDETLEILKLYAAEAPFPVRIYVNEKRLGASQNFSQAIKLCKGDYIALCDQDDIWLPEKLEKIYHIMREAEEAWGEGVPLLVYSDLKVVNSDGQVMAPSFMKIRKIRHLEGRVLNSLLVQNFVTGCTVLANRALIKKALPMPSKAVMHDWWLALVAAAQGNIVFSGEPLVGYRRHEENVIGARGFTSRENISRILQINQVKKEIAAALAQAICLRDRLKLLDSEEYILSMLNDYIKHMQNGGFSAVKAVFRHGSFKQGLLRNPIYLLMLLEGSYRKEL